MTLRFVIHNDSRYMRMCEEMDARCLLGALRTGVDARQVSSPDMVNGRVCRRMADTLRLMAFDKGKGEPRVDIIVRRGESVVSFQI